MVIETQKIVSKTNGRSYSIKQHLTCKSYGNYVAPCLIENCGHQYVGQTKNEYRLRWNGHRQKLTKNILDDQKGEAALNKHFVKYHANKLAKTPLHNAFEVIFVEQPLAENIDIAKTIGITVLNPRSTFKKW